MLVDNNLTQVELAKELDVSKQHFSKLINCNADPSFGLIEKFDEYCKNKGIIIDDMWEVWKKSN